MCTNYVIKFTNNLDDDVDGLRSLHRILYACQITIIYQLAKVYHAEIDVEVFSWYNA